MTMIDQEQEQQIARYGWWAGVVIFAVILITASWPHHYSDTSTEAQPTISTEQTRTPQARVPHPAVHPAPAPSRPALNEDDPGWNCHSQGNGQCGRDTTSAGVTIDDETDGAFPVAQAIANWALPNVHVGSCRRGPGCVVVTVTGLRSHSAGLMHAGETEWTQPGDASVQLNPATPARARLQVTTHELGHAFGLRHQAGTTMEPVSNGAHPVPSAALRATAAANLR